MFFAITVVVPFISLLCFQVNSVLGLPSPSEDDDFNEPVPVGPENKEKRMLLAAKSGSLRNLETHEACSTDDNWPEEEAGNLTRNGWIIDRYLWKGHFDVFLDPGKYPGDDRDYIEGTLSRLQDALGCCCLKIRVYQEGATPSGDYVHIKRITEKGCQSFAGRQGGAQDLNLSDACMQSDNIILHELMHALGLKHEHNRPDRDDYLIIHWEKIDPAHHNQYYKVNPSQFSTFGLPYEYESNMHYDTTDFSVGGATMTAKSEKGKWEQLGPNSREGEITDLDRLKQRRMYSCGDEDPR